MPGEAESMEPKSRASDEQTSVLKSSSASVRQSSDETADSFTTSSILNVKTYTLLISLIYSCCSAGTAIIIGTVTTLQRAFGFSSMQIGVIQASYSVGYAGSILFVSHFAERGHKPRWVAAGAFAVALSCLIPVIPHFFIWLPAYRNSVRSLDPELELDGNQTRWNSASLCSTPLPSPTFESHGGTDSNGFIFSPSDEGGTIAYYLFALASICAGLGNSPLNTVGMTYIDDNVSKQESAFYMGIPMSMFAVGPVLGFFFHAYIMHFHADIAAATNDASVSKYPKTISSKNDPNFIGAWWISYVVVGSACLFLSSLALLFPKKLSNDSEKERTSEENEESGDAFIGEGNPSPVAEVVAPRRLFSQCATLLFALKDLLLNPVYVLTLVGSAMFSTGMTGLFYFFPKIIEHQFGVSAIVANVCFGIIEIPVGIGMFFGGYLIKRFKFSPRGAALFTPCVQIIGVAMVILMLFVRCPPERYANFEASSRALGKGTFRNFTSSCNARCGCDSEDFHPVCGADGATYFSACHAGCSEEVLRSNDAAVFASCSCANSTAMPGLCVSIPEPDTTLPSFLPCSSLIGYMVVFLFAMLAFFLTRMTIINVCIRSAGDARKGLALGLRSFLGNLMGNFASSVLFGAIIDDACVLWRRDLKTFSSSSAARVSTSVGVSGESGGDCLVYASTRFHFLTHGFAGILDSAGVVFFFMAYCLARRQSWAAKQEETEKT